MRMKPIALACLTLLAASGTQADEPSVVPMDRVQWDYEGDSFGCKLTLKAMEHGDLEIRHDAGKELSVVYRPLIPPQGSVKVSWAGAPWQDMTRSRQFSTQKGDQAYVAGSTAAFSLMHALDNGNWVSIQNDRELIQVPSIRWQDNAKDFHVCRYEVSPLSIEQARDQSLYFSLGQRTVSEDHLAMIADIAKYISLDSKVSRVLVDSYTDNTGNRLANLQLSRERAADVAAALRESGVPASIIETRGHGERYPSADNSTAKGRNKSRKVTIRIIRE